MTHSYKYMIKSKIEFKIPDVVDGALERVKVHGVHSAAKDANSFASHRVQLYDQHDWITETPIESYCNDCYTAEIYYNGRGRHVRKAVVWVESFVPDEDKKQSAKGEVAENVEGISGIGIQEK